ncbi:MAG: FtsX-like permease family protein [Gaiella sp.]
MVGVTLGVGLFCGVLFFIDGLSSSMTQRAVAPLAIDMQRIVTERAANHVVLTQRLRGGARLPAGGRAEVALEIRNPGELAAHEVTVRSLPGAGVVFVDGSARLDGSPLPDPMGSPFAQGPGRSGYNLGKIAPGATRRLSYQIEASSPTTLKAAVVRSSYSSRESVNPIDANQPGSVGLDPLAQQIALQPGVAAANPLSIGDLGVGALRANGRRVGGPAKIFGLDGAYARLDRTIDLVEGAFTHNGAVLSAETAKTLAAAIGDIATIELPDGSTVELPVSGIVDVSRSRSLFSSRRGGDLETFIYTPDAVVVPPAVFARIVLPAYERAAAAGTGRFKNPPIREIDVTLDRELLDADPATAARETKRVAAGITAVAAHQDYLLDNITNTLTVAAADARVAKRLFAFLGVPGALLAALLAAYAGNVLAEAQRREQATLRIRGAGRRHLLRMLAARTVLLTAAGAIAGLPCGFFAAAAILGRASLDRASTASLVASALIGTLGGFAATGLALYLTGRRSIDREINQDRAQLSAQSPLWRRIRVDLIGLLIVVAGTVWALRAHAFDGAPGSVYFGLSVELNLALLVLPVAVWLTGSLFAARVIGFALHRSRPASTASLGRPVTSLFRRSVGRRPWAIGNGAVVVSLIVALATSLAAFTASYDAAKVADARYANGADIRITPSPTAERTYSAADATRFRTSSIAETTPVIYGLSNVILRSARTSDPANLAAIDPASYARVAPLDTTTSKTTQLLQHDPSGILVSREMADFLKAKVGDTLHVLLARATPDQVEVDLTIIALYERLPGFPDGADAVIGIDAHIAGVPAKTPDFFLAAISSGSNRLEQATTELRNGPAAGHVQIDTRASVLDRDQSSLAALNIAGLVGLDSGFALAMAAVTIAIFVFGLLLHRRREYVTLRAQGLEPRTIRLLISAEAATVAIAGIVAGVAVGAVMGYYLVTVLRPLFVLDPGYTLPLTGVALPVALVLLATAASSVLGSRLVNRLQPTELLRDE